MKRIVIMGATSGIGLRVAEIFAKAGWLVGAAGRNDKALKRLQAEYPKNVRFATIDIDREEAPTHLRDLISRLGGMDIYFHVSGIGYENKAMAPERNLSISTTNVVGFTRMIDTAFRYFRAHGGKGRIAAVTSIAGTKGIGEMAAYSASKKYQQTYLTALDQLARMQGLEIGFTDIRPGWIRTPLLKPDQVYPLTMETDYAVVRIIRAIIEKKRVCTVDWRWNLIVDAWRLIPDRVWERIPFHISTAKPEAEKSDADKADKEADKEKK